MTNHITPSLGPDFNQVGLPYFDAGQPGASPELGTVMRGQDGGEYFWVQASAAIAATANTGTQVTLTFPAFTVATGAGGFYTFPGRAAASGDRLWVRRGAFNAAPA